MLLMIYCLAIFSDYGNFCYEKLLVRTVGIFPDIFSRLSNVFLDYVGMFAVTCSYSNFAGSYDFVRLNYTL